MPMYAILLDAGFQIVDQYAKAQILGAPCRGDEPNREREPRNQTREERLLPLELGCMASSTLGVGIQGYGFRRSSVSRKASEGWRSHKNCATKHDVLYRRVVANGISDRSVGIVSGRFDERRVDELIADRERCGSIGERSVLSAGLV